MPYRQPIHGLFERYLTRFPEEVATVQQIKDFVEEHPDCFERTQLKGHVCGSAWLLSPDKTKVLLTHHRKLNMWVQLGGHADGETNILEVARKEAIEESGISDVTALSAEIFDIDIHVIPARKQDPEHLHYDCRFLLIAGDDEYSVSDESHDLAWVPLEEVMELSNEVSMARMVLKTPGFLESL